LKLQIKNSLGCLVEDDYFIWIISSAITDLVAGQFFLRGGHRL